jgi:hypothetical protein
LPIQEDPPPGPPSDDEPPPEEPNQPPSLPNLPQGPPQGPPPPPPPGQPVMAQAAQPNDDRAKFPSPPNFKGRADGARTWLMMLEEWLDTPGMPQPLSDRNKVRMALFKIEGEANPWKNSRLSKYRAITAAHPQGNWPSWVDFKADFLAQWGESNEPAKALRQLKNYEYREHTKTPLGQILTTVDTLIQEAGINDEEQKKSFLRQAIPPNYALMLAIS